jgi:hypothetical protein
MAGKIFLNPKASLVTWRGFGYSSRPNPKTADQDSLSEGNLPINGGRIEVGVKRTRNSLSRLFYLQLCLDRLKGLIKGYDWDNRISVRITDSLHETGAINDFKKSFPE